MLTGHLCVKQSVKSLLIEILYSPTVACDISRHYHGSFLVSPRNDFWGTTAEIPTQRWSITTQFKVLLLTGRAAMDLCYPDLGSDASFVWTFCSCSSDVISRNGGGCFPRWLLPYISDISVCRPKGYGFCSVFVWQRVYTLSISVWNRGYGLLGNYGSV